jgi:tRNA(Ile)-lysidine synthase TilS/MesJ
MNNDLSFTRVRIRKELLPLFSTFNPRIVETLARTSELMTAISDHRPDSDRIGSVPADRSLNAELVLAELKRMPAEELNQCLRSWLKRNRGDLRGLGLKHIEAVGRLIHSRKSGKMVELPGGGTAVKQGGRLRFVAIKVEK